MEKPRDILNAYIKFRKTIKSSLKLNVPTTEQCIILTKEDMSNWKKYYEYSKKLANNITLINDWELKIKSKNKNQKPKFNVLKDYNKIKTHISKGGGISFVNQEFINHFNPDEKKCKFNCKIGNNKIVIDINGGITVHDCLICKTGSKSTLEYIIFETIHNYKYSLIDDIIKKKNINIKDKNSFPLIEINKIYCYKCKKIQNSDAGIDNNAFNFNQNNINFGNNKQDYIKSNNVPNNSNEGNIPDFLIEFMILLYKLSKDIKYKLASKDNYSEDLYIINADFLKEIKMRYNYKSISEEIQKFNYISEIEFKNKIPDLINSIIQKQIINEIVPLDDISEMKIVPNIEKLCGENHFVNFGLVNNRMYELLEQIKNFFRLYGKLNPIKNTFYFTPQLFYKGQNYIKIGFLNNEDVFEMQYYIKLDLCQTNLLSLVYELKAAKSAQDFFKSKNIDIDKKEVHELTYYRQKIGKVFRFKINVRSSTEISKPKITGSNIKDPRLTSVQRNPITNPKVSGFSNSPSDFSYDLSYLDKCNIKSFKEITYPPMIGLKNIGQTCYMNAALQCFSNTRALTSYFLNSNKLDIIKNNTIIINELDEPSLVIEYLKLIRHLWCDPPKSFYAPLEFKEKIGKIDPLFKNFEANDAKDFVNFMVMRMHEELNGVDNSLLKQTNLVEPPMPINPFNQQQVLQSYLYEFQINFNSFISNCFYGTTQGEFECQNCKMRLYQSGQNMPLIKYNYQTFFFLNFPLDEVRKFILSNQMLYTKYMNSGVNPNVAVDLIDCFYYHQKDELLDCYCERCQSSNAKVISRTRLFVAPSYLIIILNRGKGRQFNIKINFPEEFDTNGIFINPSGIFQLYAVVKHFGESGSSGHFTAYCRSPIDNCWYFYNDDMVSPVGPQDMYQIRDIGLTYMLFYQKKK